MDYPNLHFRPPSRKKLKWSEDTKHEGSDSKNEEGSTDSESNNEESKMDESLKQSSEKVFLLYLNLV